MVKKLRKELENELKTHTSEIEFRRLKEKHPSLESFRIPMDLIGFLEPGGEYERKDDLLAILIKEYGSESPMRVSGTLLLLSFLPVLKNIYYTQCHNFHDDEELICTLQCCFLEAAQSYPLDKRPAKIAANLKFLTIRSFLETQSALCDESGFQRRLLEEAEESGFDEELLSEAYPGIAPAAVGDRESVEMTIRNFRAFVDAGIVDEGDFRLIVETRVYDRDLCEVAGEMGIAYAVARKRRYRAEQAMKEHFENIF